jgi:hypothetical protein
VTSILIYFVQTAVGTEGDKDHMSQRISHFTYPITAPPNPLHLKISRISLYIFYKYSELRFFIIYYLLYFLNVLFLKKIKKNLISRELGVESRELVD